MGFYFVVHDMYYSNDTFLIKYLNKVDLNEPNYKFEHLATCSVKGYKRAEQSVCLFVFSMVNISRVSIHLYKFFFFF